MLVDSHCHLNFEVFKDDISKVISRAQDNGVGILQTICTKISEFEQVYSLTKLHANIYCSVGVHPLEVKNEGIYLSEQLIEFSKREKVIGIGEVGLDYHYQRENSDLQKKSFIEHIKAAQETQLPLIVHTRDADDDTIEILAKMKSEKDFSAVLHCFTASRELALAALEIGFYISASGIITFKNATDIQEIFKEAPLEKILVETDSPYLAPVPNRGKRNEPANVKHTANFLAKLKGIDIEEVSIATTNNFFKLFTKAKNNL